MRRTHPDPHSAYQVWKQSFRSVRYLPTKLGLWWHLIQNGMRQRLRGTPTFRGTFWRTSIFSSASKSTSDSDELPYFALKYTREESEMIHKISASDSGKERALQQGEECRLWNNIIRASLRTRSIQCIGSSTRASFIIPFHPCYLSQTSRIKKTTAPRMQSPKVSYLATKQMNAFLDRACRNQLRLMPCRAYFGHISWWEIG